MSRARAAHLGPELRRPLVLDAALPLFAEDGYDAVSMQAIADAAGVSKPVLYSCYASKEELFDELMRREERKLWHMVEDSVPIPGALGEKEDLLRHGLAALLRAVAQAPDAFRVLYLQRHGETRIERGREHWEQRMSEVLAAWTRLPDRETALLGRMLVALAELGFRVQLEEPGQWEPDALAAYLARVVVRGIPRSD
ncbi:MAG TPA: helix-turn-helix domain-containing protein [Baekduia sp.]|uniref:TetR/AcrR family transcriptional regulator n=1 Tax=Baekduia sp. TaxID=2600305 RepID=UPI002D787143|nr:helix-turn-helix domain-containing protein [Baekduia sp.]HET6509630.1 helix-turn-helix domain-containing protein [Baekduia sp.]